MLDHAHRHPKGLAGHDDRVPLHVDERRALGEHVTHRRVADEQVTGRENELGVAETRRQSLTRVVAERTDGVGTHVVVQHDARLEGTAQHGPERPAAAEVDHREPLATGFPALRESTRRGDRRRRLPEPGDDDLDIVGQIARLAAGSGNDEETLAHASKRSVSPEPTRTTSG